MLSANSMNFRKIRISEDHTSGRPPVIRKQTRFALQYFFLMFKHMKKFACPATFLFSPQAVCVKENYFSELCYLFLDCFVAFSTVVVLLKDVFRNGWNTRL